MNLNENRGENYMAQSRKIEDSTKSKFAQRTFYLACGRQVQLWFMNS